MNKKIRKKDNVIDFPNKLSSIEKEIEAIVFAAAEPLNIETIQNKISKKAEFEVYPCFLINSKKNIKYWIMIMSYLKYTIFKTVNN